MTVETYLRQPVDTEEVPTPAAYYVAIADLDNAAVADRGRQAGQALGENPAEFVDALAHRVIAQVETAGNPLIHTAAGGMRLENTSPPARSNSWCTVWTLPQRYQTWNRRSSAISC